MIRALIAVLIINSFPAPALAQIVRVAGPVRISVTAPALSLAPSAIPGLAPGLSAPSLTAPLMTAPIPALAVAPVPAALAASFPGAAATPAKPEVEPARALTVAKSAAASAAEFTARPGSLESDRSRADFADGAARSPSMVEAVVYAVAPSRLWAALRPSAPAADRPAPPVPPEPSPRLAPFLGGTFLAQVASNALQVTMPLLILQITGSAATAAFAAPVSAALDAAGTIIGG